MDGEEFENNRKIIFSSKNENVQHNYSLEIYSTLVFVFVSFLFGNEKNKIN